MKRLNRSLVKFTLMARRWPWNVVAFLITSVAGAVVVDWYNFLSRVFWELLKRIFW